MWKFIFDLTVREAYSCDNLVWDVDQGTDLYRHTLAFLMELALWLLHLALVSTDEKRGDMVRVRELPWAVVLPLANHVFEIIDHLLWLSSLLEARCEELCELALVGGVTLAVDAKEDG